jgi:hypothetical protein
MADTTIAGLPAVTVPTSSDKYHCQQGGSDKQVELSKISEFIINQASLSQLNDIINGGFPIWQRAVSFPSIADQTFFADRFEYAKAGTMVHDITRSATVPNDTTNYSIRLDVTTAQASLTGSTFVMVGTKIEGYNFKKYVGQNAVLSFWVIQKQALMQFLLEILEETEAI